jgi:hypothetical protein
MACAMTTVTLNQPTIMVTAKIQILFSFKIIDCQFAFTQPNGIQFGTTCRNTSALQQLTLCNHSNFSIDFQILCHVDA